MAKNPLNVVLDTNILISSLLFEGKQKQILKLVQEGKIVAFTSPILFAELTEILIKKFKFSNEKIILIQELIEENFILVNPVTEIHVISDEDDNRVLEAAIEGNCIYIITGDKDLLRLKHFRVIKIITSDSFLSNEVSD